MGMPVDTPRTWRFGVFELDASSGELRRNGTVVKLREQPASILLLLLEHSGQMVTREQLRRYAAGEKMLSVVDLDREY